MAFDLRSRAYIALSVMGIGIAVYHGYGELTYSLSSCSLSHVFNCNSVFQSGYTSVFGIQFWAYGVAWFPVATAVGLWVINRYGTTRGSVLVPFLLIGDIFTLYPWDIEIRLLHGVYCLVCVSMYVVNYVLTFIAASAWSSGTE